jgi:hypothetical protein
MKQRVKGVESFGGFRNQVIDYLNDEDNSPAGFKNM